LRKFDHLVNNRANEIFRLYINSQNTDIDDENKLNNLDLFSELAILKILINNKNNKYLKKILSFYETDTIYHETNNSRNTKEIMKIL